MSSDIAWPRSTLKAAGVRLIDCDHQTPPDAKDGYPYIAIPQLKNGHISLEGVRRISAEHYLQWTKKLKPQAHDVIVVRRCNSGESALVPPGLECAIGQNLVILRSEGEVVQPQFLRWLVNGPDWWEQVSKFINVGAVFDSLRCRDIPNFELTIPPINQQREISALLDALDDRITLLRETNATLEAIAQALFKSWFVDFDPVHAKLEGRAPEGMDEATAALFPDGFEESELGLVPRGWRVEPLTEVFDFKEGPGIRNWQYTNSDQGTKFINIRCIQDGDLSLATASRITDEEANGKYAHFHLQEWDVVVSTSGTLGRSAIVRHQHLPLMLNTSVIRFRPIRPKMDFGYCYQYLNSAEFLYKLESMASGSVQKNFGPMHIKQIYLVCPSERLIARYESITRPLFEKLVANRERIANVATLRDTLLPRLISGQLRLPEVESLKEKAIL